MTTTDENKAVGRSDLRYALAWTLRRPYRAVFVVVLLALAGAGSVIGILRWQHVYFRWSFAVICWLVAVFVLIKLAAQARPSK